MNGASIRAADEPRPEGIESRYRFALLGVRRFLAVSIGGTAPGVVKENPFFFEYILKPLFRGFYDDMAKMEERVQESGLEWTVLRPPRLLNRPARGQVREAVGHSP